MGELGGWERESWRVGGLCGKWEVVGGSEEVRTWRGKGKRRENEGQKKYINEGDWWFKGFVEFSSGKVLGCFWSLVVVI